MFQSCSLLLSACVPPDVPVQGAPALCGLLRAPNVPVRGTTPSAFLLRTFQVVFGLCLPLLLPHHDSGSRCPLSSAPCSCSCSPSLFFLPPTPAPLDADPDTPIQGPIFPRCSTPGLPPRMFQSGCVSYRMFQSRLCALVPLPSLGAPVQGAPLPCGFNLGPGCSSPCLLSFFFPLCLLSPSMTLLRPLLFAPHVSCSSSPLPSTPGSCSCSP